MMILRITFLIALSWCGVQAVLNKNIKRREVFEGYGPPRPAAQYGPPHREPHREYGVPQKIPFREYGPPAIKYGPPKLNFISSGGSSGGSSGIYEQVKQHFGVPKPFYGPPHKPHTSYGPPPPKPQAQYGPPPARPQAQYGPPPSRPQAQYGPPPKPAYGPPPPQALPQILPLPAFKPEHQPASSYGPPPSGPINIPKPNYGPPLVSAPQPAYGPPPLPSLPHQSPAPNFNQGAETTIIVTGNQQQQQQIQHHHHTVRPVQQVQIEIDSNGHTHGANPVQPPFHKACDGWKPIIRPVNNYVENNNIETQGGYSQVQQSFGSGGFTTQYSATGGSQGGGSIIDGLTDEQLVAIALQSEGSNSGANFISSGHGNNFNNNQHLNSIESEVLQVGLGAFDESYSKLPADSFAPGSVHAQKFNGQEHNFGGPPQQNGGGATFIIEEQQQNFGGNAGQQPKQPLAYRPPVPQGLLESIGASVAHQDQFGVKPALEPPTYIPPAVNEIPASGPGNFDNSYGPPPPPLPQALPLTSQHPQDIVEQQLPQPRPSQTFVQGHSQSQSQFNFAPPKPNYLPPPPPPAAPQNNYLPPPNQARGPVTQLHLVNRPPPPPPPPNAQYLPPPQFLQGSQGLGSFQQNAHAFTSVGSGSANNEQFIHTQGLPLQQSVQFNQAHGCGHGPNLVGGSFQVQQQQQQFTGAGSSHAYNAITQSIPLAETHQQFVEVPNENYGPPNGNQDHEGYASQHTSVSALPDGTNPQNLPGLDGLNVISAQKSESIELGQHRPAQSHNFQLELATTPAQKQAQHDEILSQGLLQSILTAIEEPKSSQQQQLPNHYHLAPNHNYGNIYDAQSRSDTAVHEHEHATTEEADKETLSMEMAGSETEKVQIETDKHKSEVSAVLREIEPIVAEDVPLA